MWAIGVALGFVSIVGYRNRKRAQEDLRRIEFLYKQAPRINPPPTTDELRYMQNIHGRVSVYVATPSKWFTEWPPDVDWLELPMDESFSKFLRD